MGEQEVNVTWVVDTLLVRIKKEGNEFVVEHAIQNADNSYDTTLWQTFGGCVGYNDSVFMTYQEAIDFVLKGIKEQDLDPDIWLDMLEVRPVRLPVVRIGKKIFYADRRLKQLREVCNPHNFEDISDTLLDFFIKHSE